MLKLEPHDDIFYVIIMAVIIGIAVFLAWSSSNKNDEFKAKCVKTEEVIFVRGQPKPVYRCPELKVE